MLLFNAESISKSFGTKDLFKDLSLTIFEGDQIGLIGQNGSGKSTFLKIIAGIESADKGTLSARRDLKIGYLPQSCDFPEMAPIDVLMGALEGYVEEYDKERIAKTWLSKLGFRGDETSAKHLSGGWKKRLMLAREMIRDPDLLLLDEPTNHLDLEGILWLERFLKREAPTYLLVSHDRYFLQNATNRIVEIDPSYPKGIFSIEGPYDFFLLKKEEFLLGQLQQERSMATKVRRETEWLRSNPKARTTKSQARIDQAEDLLEDFSDIRKRNRQSRAAIEFIGSERDTRKLIVAKNLSKRIGERLLFQGIDFLLSPGTRMGLMGPNGSGKTTLLRLLNGELLPDLGTLKKADALQIVYFDQHRNQLPDHLTLREALSPTGDFVRYRGQPMHVNGWCKKFLFSPDLLGMPIGVLSGGERARIAIAHLMLQPADVLLLDEPSNDLDIPTLEILENNLIEFPGAVVLITHDRCMLDRLCNTFLALGNPDCTETFASYAQWEAASFTEAPPPKAKPAPAAKPQAKESLSYKEKKELDQIENRIASLEAKLKLQKEQLENSEDNSSGLDLHALCRSVAHIEAEIEALYQRWEELSLKQQK